MKATSGPQEETSSGGEKGRAFNNVWIAARIGRAKRLFVLVGAGN
jgi:hypothetical protein